MRKINFCLGFLCLGFALFLQASVAVANSTFFVKVNPRGTYLATDPVGIDHPADTADAASRLELAPYINDPNIRLQPGDIILLRQVGDLDFTIFGPEGEQAANLLGVFVNSSNQFLMPGPQTAAPSHVSSPTLYEHINNDIPQDFLIDQNQVAIEVPSGASAMLFTPDEIFWSDNADVNNDYGVWVEITIITNNFLLNQDTQHSCILAGNSVINPDLGSLGEAMPVVGVPFSLNYTSDRFRGAAIFNPKSLGLGGWMPNLVHHYDATQSILYSGDNGQRNIAAVAFPGGGVYVTDLSGSEIYVFDSAGLHRQTRNALTGSVIYNFTYDGSGRLLGIVDAFGNTTQFQYIADGARIISPYGQSTYLTMDSAGYLATLTNPNNESYHLTHSATGLLLGFQKPGGQLNQVTYDSHGYLVKDQGAGGNFLELSRSFDSATSTQTVITRTALNRETQFSILAEDAEHSTRMVLSPDGSQSQNITETQGTDQSTDPFGGTLTSVKEQDPRFGWLAPFSRQSNYVLPGSNINLSVSTQKNAQLSNASNPLSLTSLSTSTTLQGNRTYSSQYTQTSRILLSQSPLGRTLATALNPQGQPISVRRGSLTQVNMSYDARGRLTQVAQGSRNLRLAYDALGNLASSTDFLGKTTSYQYDAAGRVKRQIAPNGQSILMSYDTNGNLTSLTPPGRSAHNFGYNLFELLENYVPPSIGSAMSGANVYSYNLDRQLTEISRSDGGQINYNYGAGSGLLESITSSDGGYNLQYYPNSSLVQTLWSPDSVNMSYEYFGNLPKRVTSSGQVSSSVEYAYQSDGALASIGVNGSAIGLAYDRDGLLKATGAMSYIRDNVGSITNNTLRQTVEEMKYDSFGAMIKRKLVEGRRTLLSEEIERDKLGRITKVDSTHKDRSYEYDALGRLVYARVGHDAREYQYDANGNRTAMIEGRDKTKAKYDAQDRLVEYGDTRYEYSDNGELKAKIITVEEIGDDAFCRFFKIKKKKDKRTEYDYDIFGNLQSVHFPDGKQIEYIYDGQNRRIGKRVNGHLAQSLVYQSQTQIAAELNAQGAVTKRFIYGSKPNMPDYMVMGNKEYRIVSDQVGTPMMLVDAATGKVVEEYLYDEFGRALDEPRHSSLLPFGFAGGLADRDTDFVHFGARDYDPQVGRWTSKDPIGFAGGDTNLFGYAFLDPVNFFDMSGLDAQIVLIGPHVGVEIITNNTKILVELGPAGGFNSKTAVATVIAGLTGGTVPGNVNITYGGIAGSVPVPGTYRKLNINQDAELLNLARIRQQQFSSGELMFNPLGTSNAGATNCIGFAYDLWGQ